MPVPVSDRAVRWRAALAGERPVTGMWVASGSPVCAEICAGAGFDWLLIDGEHAPNDLRSTLAQLQAVVSIGGIRLRGKAGTVKCGIKKVARSVARKRKLDLVPRVPGTIEPVDDHPLEQLPTNSLLSDFDLDAAATTSVDQLSRNLCTHERSRHRHGRCRIPR